MKQIPLLSGRCLVLELPERVYNPVVTTSNRIGYSLEGISKYESLPPGNWRIIGMLSEVMEEQAAGLVEYTGLGNGVDRWLNYVNNGDKFTALESLHSSIEAEGWYFENPLENEQKRIGLGTLDNFDQDYEQAQSRALDRSRCLLLRREEEI